MPMHDANLKMTVIILLVMMHGGWLETGKDMENKIDTEYCTNSVNKMLSISWD